jgi:tetratricopeptide (TPR) repeat protein
MSLTNTIEGLGNLNDRVRVSETADLSAARITVEEGFVLSRIDGVSAIKSICLVSGLGHARTIEILKHLHDLGLVLIGDEKAQPRPHPTEPPRPTRTPSDPPVHAVRVEHGAGRAPTPPSTRRPTRETEAVVARPPPGEPERQGGEARGDESKEGTGPDFGAAVILPEGEEAYELTTEMRKKIRGFFQRIDELNDFEIIGASPLADSKTLRRAYFRRSKEFHPDRFFQKEIGPYREMVQAIFKRIVVAYQNLEDEERRRAYAARVKALIERTPSQTARAIRAGAGTPASGTPAAPSRREGVKLPQDDAERAFAEGEAAATEGRLREAATHFLRAAELNPSLVFVLQAAEAVLASGDLIRAGDYGKKITRIYSNSAGAHLFLAKVYEASGLMGDSQEEAERALEIEAGCTEARELLERLMRTLRS